MQKDSPALIVTWGMKGDRLDARIFVSPSSLIRVPSCGHSPPSLAVTTAVPQHQQASLKKRADGEWARLSQGALDTSSLMVRTSLSVSGPHLSSGHSSFLPVWSGRHQYQKVWLFPGPRTEAGSLQGCRGPRRLPPVPRQGSWSWSVQAQPRH